MAFRLEKKIRRRRRIERLDEDCFYLFGPVAGTEETRGKKGK